MDEQVCNRSRAVYLLSVLFCDSTCPVTGGGRLVDEDMPAIQRHGFAKPIIMALKSIWAAPVFLHTPGGYRIEEVVDGPLPAQQPAAQLPTNSSITTSNISSGSIAGSNGEQGLHSSSRSAPAAYSSPRSRLPGIAAVEHLFAMLPGAGPPGPAQGQAAQGRPAAAAGGPGAAAGQAAGSGQSDWGRLLTTSWQVRSQI